MADTKVFSPGLVTYWFIGEGGIADIYAPTAAEINAGINLSEAVADDGTEVNASESSDIEDRSIVDAGNAVEPGIATFAATINLFRPMNMSDLNDPYVKAYNAFKTQRVKGYIVKRVNYPWADVATAGDEVSVFKVLSAYTANDTAGEDAVKFLVEFLPQGQMSIKTRVETATPVVATPDVVSLAVGDYSAVIATLGGVEETGGCVWSTDDPAIATVEHGVIHGVSAGTATVTVTHPASTGTAETVAVTVTA